MYRADHAEKQFSLTSEAVFQERRERRAAAVAFTASTISGGSRGITSQGRRRDVLESKIRSFSLIKVTISHGMERKIVGGNSRGCYLFDCPFLRFRHDGYPFRQRSIRPGTDEIEAVSGSGKTTRIMKEA